MNFLKKKIEKKNKLILMNFLANQEKNDGYKKTRSICKSSTYYIKQKTGWEAKFLLSFLVESAVPSISRLYNSGL